MCWVPVYTDPPVLRTKDEVPEVRELQKGEVLSQIPSFEENEVKGENDDS